jgi:hemoglobin-like flavoprotein
MNQDQVKAKLLLIEDAPMEFTLIFSGKKSKKVNGLYKTDTREIIIHNRNFDEAGRQDENLLLYTAIHEYAHHLHACSRGGTLSAKAHTSEFWAIFHGLLEKAEKKNIYQDMFKNSPELAELTKMIRERFLVKNGSLVKEMGRCLLQAHELCDTLGARFEDYIDRVLRIPRTAAAVAIKMHQYDLNPEVGADNMRFLAGIKNDTDRSAAEKALIKGKSPDMVKMAVRGTETETNPHLALEKEKERLERTIASLSRRLEEVKKELKSADNK